MSAVVDITIRDGTAYLGVDDAELWEWIIEATSFKLEGQDFRQRRGDKRTKLVRNRKCPVGLLDRVCRAVDTYGGTVDLSYADTQMAPKPTVDMRLFGIEPRDYQREAELCAVLNDRGIFRVPTGGGKTLVAAQIIAARGYYAVVIVPTIDLLRQTKDDLASCLARSAEQSGNKYWNENNSPQWKIGQLGDGVVDPQPVTVATIRTLAKVLNVAYESYEYAEYDDSDDTKVSPHELRGWVERLGVVVVDEAHQLGAKVLFETVTAIPAPCKFGMSASPWRDDGADLMIEAATGPPIFFVPTQRLVEGGYLMAPEIRVLDTSPWWQSAAWGQTCARCKKQWLHWTKECTCGCRSFRSQFTEAYKNEIVENEARNTHIAQVVRELDRSTLVLVKQVAHGRNLEKLIPNAVFLSGRNKGEDRHAVLDAVRAGLQRVIICTTIGDMGLDIPSLEALVLAGGGKSSTRHLQRIGRVVRPWPGKRRPVVVDLDDSHIHTWFANHIRERRKVEHAEWEGLATWS